MKRADASLGLEKLEFRLNRHKQEETGIEEERDVNPIAVTIFPTKSEFKNHRSGNTMDRREKVGRRQQLTQHQTIDQNVLSWVIEGSETVKLAPKAKQMLGKLQLSKRRDKLTLVCLAPAHLPLEGILVARGLAQVLPKVSTENKSELPQQGRAAALMTTNSRQQNPSHTQAYVYVMVTNFSHEHVVFSKAAVLRIAEETAENLVVTANSSDCQNRWSYFKTSINTRENNSEFTQYLKGKLGHLNPKERSIMEPVLWKYRHVIHDEGSKDFRCTDLAENWIITGDARPIRKRLYRVPFSLREEMETQIQDMLKKEIIEPSTSPWNSPVILVPKASTDGKR
jgi:hypothetical protein